MAKLVVETNNGELKTFDVKGRSYVGVIPDDHFSVLVKEINTPAATAVTIDNKDFVTGETVGHGQMGALVLCRDRAVRYQWAPPDDTGRRPDLVISAANFSNLGTGMEVRAKVVEATKLDWKGEQTRFYDSTYGGRSQFDLVGAREPKELSVWCIWWGKLREMVSQATKVPEGKLSRFER